MIISENYTEFIERQVTQCINEQGFLREDRV